MTAVSADRSPADRAARRTKASPAEIVNASALGVHLGLTRQRVAQLADEGVIERRSDGRFDQTRARLAYVGWLRSPERRSAKFAAASDLEKAKAALVWLRVREREGRLVELNEALKFITELAGMFRVEAEQLPARIGARDLVERRRIEGIVHAMLHRIADAAEARAKVLDPNAPKPRASEPVGAEDDE